jgi:proline racemase
MNAARTAFHGDCAAAGIMAGAMLRLRAIDSHTGGEPTRVVVSGGPDLAGGTVAARRERFHREFDRFRSAIVNEPRGADAIVGAMLVEPEDPACAAGVFFFNNVGPIGMCGHGTIGVVITLAHLGRIGAGVHRIETPVGVVTATLEAGNRVRVDNVASHRACRGVRVDVPGIGPVTGDIAYGGNWFFLVDAGALDLSLAEVPALTARCRAIRTAVNAAGHPDVDHVELFGPPRSGGDARNFVLCPGGAYDRSPCGTGTSAKLACLAADGKLAEGARWIQESILGTTFEGRYAWRDRAAGTIAPTIAGTAFVTAESTLLIDERDALAWGIR